MSKNEVVNTYGYFPDQIENEEVFKLPDYYQDGDKGKVKAMIQLEGTLPDGTPSTFFMLYADKNNDGHFVKIQCNATVNKKILQRIKTDSEFKMPFEFVVFEGTSAYGDYTAIKMTS
mgnify:CR=1 FL=1